MPAHGVHAPGCSNANRMSGIPVQKPEIASKITAWKQPRIRRR